jgi:hypothetical protein
MTKVFAKSCSVTMSTQKGAFPFVLRLSLSLQLEYSFLSLCYAILDLIYKLLISEMFQYSIVVGVYTRIRRNNIKIDGRKEVHSLLILSSAFGRA